MSSTHDDFRNLRILESTFYTDVFPSKCFHVIQPQNIFLKIIKDTIRVDEIVDSHNAFSFFTAERRADVTFGWPRDDANLSAVWLCPKAVSNKAFWATIKRARDSFWITTLLTLTVTWSDVTSLPSVLITAVSCCWMMLICNFILVSENKRNLTGARRLSQNVDLHKL